jgi:hypothetical protein
MSKLTHPLFELLTADAWIQTNKALRWALGNDEAVIYAELIACHIYFQNREQLTDEGYFFNTVDDLYIKTHVEKRAQRSAIKKLVASGLIDMRVQSLPPVRYFKIWDAPALLQSFLQKGKFLMENARKALEDAKKDKTALFKGTKSSPNKYPVNKKQWLYAERRLTPENINLDPLEIIITDVAP